MASKTLPKFADLRRTYGAGTWPSARPDERARLMGYLHQLGLAPTTVEGVYHAVLTLPDEEELSAFRCREGVAISHASDGWWLLLRSGESMGTDAVHPSLPGDVRC